VACVIAEKTGVLSLADSFHATSTVDPWAPSFVERMLERTPPMCTRLAGALPAVRVKAIVRLDDEQYAVERMIGASPRLLSR